MESEMQSFPGLFFRLFLLTLTAIAGMIFIGSARADFPGGLIEQPSGAVARPPLSSSQIQSFLPSRGKFTFPPPYNTIGVRITNAGDCGGGDCLYPVGYSYWRNMNNSAGSDIMYIFLGMDRNRGGGGPTLFSYNKVSDEVKNLGPLFGASNPLSWGSGEGWYFSASQPTKLYLNDGPRMVRYDVLTHQSQTVYDASQQFGSGYTLWQMHSSDDDRVHSATLRNSGGYLGCLVYHEDTGRFQYFPQVGGFDECNLDRSGRWLMSLENVDGAYGLDMRVFDLASGVNLLTPGINPIINGGLTSSAQMMASGVERRVLDQDGAVGHADMGYGYVIGADNWGSHANSLRVWDFNKHPLSGSLVFYDNDYSAPASNHITHLNARAGTPIDQQFACGSGASARSATWGNEVVCYRFDGSLNVLVTAPVMTDMNSSVGGSSYGKEPKGNIDVTGQYFIWSSNAGGSHFDAYLVKVPAQKLGVTTGGGTTTPPADTTAPTVAVTSPASGTTVSGTLAVSADATDNVGVAGVQFKLDGANLGTEITGAPYTVNWNTATSTAGTHTLTAVARDVAGNATTSAPVTATLSSGDTQPPAIASVAISNLSTTGAAVTWTTGEPSDSQVEYGPTTAYGSTTTLDAAAVTSHSATLSGLSSSTLYHYRALSRDTAGNLARSADATFTTAAVVSSSGVQDVAWTGAVNVTVTGNSLQKTGGCDGCQDAGAISQQQIHSGDGYMEFTVSETNLVRYLGLTNGTSVTDAARIPFAFKLVSGYAEVRENGGYRWDTPVVSGDVLRIAVESGTVTYAKNGTVLYRSGVSPVYPLRADAALSSRAATITDVVISGTSTDTGAGAGTTTGSGTSPGADTGSGTDTGSGSGSGTGSSTTSDSGSTSGSGTTGSDTRSGSSDTGATSGTETTSSVPGGVSWSGVNTTVSGDTLKKTGGCDGCEDASAISLQQIDGGEGHLQFTVSGTSLVRYVGLFKGNNLSSPSQLPFSLKLVSGYAEVRERGRYLSDTPIVTGDVLRISVKSGAVSYAKNGTVFYTSKTTPPYPLRAGAVLSSMGATVKGAVLSGGAISIASLQSAVPGASGLGGGSLDPWALITAALAAGLVRRRSGGATTTTIR